MTEKELFNSLVEQELELLNTKETIKIISDNAKESDIDKESIKLIKKAAKLHANVKFEELKSENEALVAKYEELTS